MDSGNNGSLQSPTTGAGDTNPSHSTLFNPTPLLQPLQSQPNFFDLSSFSVSQTLNPNSIFNLDSHDPFHNLDSQYRNPNPVDDKDSNFSANPTIKTPKKRTRASRRTPTTVLTTDTTNFRRMVQEFTGIPAGPLSGASSSSPPFSQFSRFSPFTRRFDVLGGGSSPVPPVRPSAKKIPVQLQQPLYLNSSSSSITAKSNFQLTPSETRGFTKHPLNLSNLENRLFPFQNNVTEAEIHQLSERLDPFVSSSTPLKRWRGEDESVTNFEGVNVTLQNTVVSSRNDGVNDHDHDQDQDQLPGNEDNSWIYNSD